MTKRTFVFVGLFLISLSAFWISLETHILLCTHKVGVLGSHSSLLVTIGVPVLFGVILWKHLRFTGRSRPFSGTFIMVYVVSFFLGAMLSPLLIQFLDVLNPNDIMMEEIRAWVDAGKVGEFQLTDETILKVSAFNGFATVTASWVLLLILILVAFDPRFPRGNISLRGSLRGVNGKPNSIVSEIKRNISFRYFGLSERQS